MSASTLKNIENLLDQLTIEEQKKLVEFLTRHLRKRDHKKQPLDLYGAWRGRFPASFDLDSSLAEIRKEWKSEWN